ncbi:MAG: serine hydrolase domain-containing protein [Planctomycetota bacterium]
MTQAYTAVAVLQLVEQGALSLDDAIGKHLKDIPETWKPITIRQLLAHSSELDYTKQPGLIRP